MQLVSGERFYPLNPRPEEIFIEDIAHALSNLCRYGGHCSEFYSVAQHSVLTSLHLGDGPLGQWGLLHDGTEAYIGDIIRPLKQSGLFSSYHQAEEQLLGALAFRFSLPYPMPDEVKRADNSLLLAEARDLMGSPDWAEHRRKTWQVEPYPHHIRPWGPGTARFRFLRRFLQLFPSGGVLGRHPAQRTNLDHLLQVGKKQQS